ncbi:hypothetical protein ADUPG1_013459, partial [Aduncisulcus paluster]
PMTQATPPVGGLFSAIKSVAGGISHALVSTGLVGCSVGVVVHRKKGEKTEGDPQEKEEKTLSLSEHISRSSLTKVLFVATTSGTIHSLSLTDNTTTTVVTLPSITDISSLVQVSWMSEDGEEETAKVIEDIDYSAPPDILSITSYSRQLSKYSELIVLCCSHGIILLHCAALREGVFGVCMFPFDEPVLGCDIVVHNDMELLLAWTPSNIAVWDVLSVIMRSDTCIQESWG